MLDDYGETVEHTVIHRTLTVAGQDAKVTPRAIEAKL